jgi:hypothetical protein
MPGYHNYLYLRLASSHIRRSSCIYSLSIFAPPFCNTQHPPQSPRNRLSSWVGQPCYRNESHVGCFALRPNARRRRQPRTKHSSSLLSCLIDGTETYLRAASDARCVYKYSFSFSFPRNRVELPRIQRCAYTDVTWSKNLLLERRAVSASDISLSDTPHLLRPTRAQLIPTARARHVNVRRATDTF